MRQQLQALDLLDEPRALLLWQQGGIQVSAARTKALDKACNVAIQMSPMRASCTRHRHMGTSRQHRQAPVCKQQHVAQRITAAQNVAQ